MLSEWLFKLTKCIDSAKKKCQINAEIIQSPQILIFFFLSWHSCCFNVFCFLFSHYCSFEAGTKKKKNLKISLSVREKSNRKSVHSWLCEMENRMLFPL